MTTLQISPHDMAAKLAARLCHDLIGPAGGLNQALDLLQDPTAQDLHQDAMALIIQSGRDLIAKLAFARLALGSGDRSYAATELEALIGDLYRGQRAQLIWSVTEQTLRGVAARTLLNFSQMALACLPYGGAAHVITERSGAEILLVVTAKSPRVRPQMEVMSGLAGEPPGDGPPGQWVQAAFVCAAVTTAGGRLTMSASDGEICFSAYIPTL